MAKVQLSGIFDTITGKLGGSVIQGGPGGLQIRTRVVPRNPQSVFQQIVRNRFGTKSNFWKEMTPGVQADFRAATGTAVTGNPLFVSNNINVILVGLEGISEWFDQAAPDPIEFEITSATDTELLFKLTGAVTTVPVATRLLLEASKLQPGSRFFNSPSSFSNFLYFEAGEDLSADTDITAAFVNRLGNLQTGKTLSMRLALVSTDNGLRSIQTIQQTIVS